MHMSWFTRRRTTAVAGVAAGLVLALVSAAGAAEAVSTARTAATGGSTAVSAAGASASTFASLQVLTTAVHAGQPVTFALQTSSIRRGRHLKQAVVIFGDGKAQTLRSLKGIARHAYARPGAYTATLRITDSGGATSTALRTVVIARKDKVVFKRTTVRLSPADLITLTPMSASSELVRLRAGLATPRARQTLLVPPGPLAPRGLVAVVDTASRGADGTTTVSAHDGGLSDAYQNLDAARSSPVGGALLLSRATADGRRRFLGPHADKAVPFSCHKPAGSDSLSVTADLSKTQISSVISLSARTFQLVVISKPVFSLGASFSGTAEPGCTAEYLIE